MSEHFVNVVAGSFHQGCLFKFGNSAGKQCTCCALFSIAFTLVKSPARWTRYDLDFILENGDSIYKRSVNKDDYLMIPELPKEITLFDSKITVNFLENRFGFLNNQSSSILFHHHDMMPPNSDGLLFLAKGICIAVV